MLYAIMIMGRYRSDIGRSDIDCIRWGEEVDVMSDVPPWGWPAFECAGGGGVTRQAIGKPLETAGLQSYGD